MSIRNTAAATIVSLGAAVLLSAQSPVPVQPPAAAEVVRFDAVVTDRLNRPIRDLGPGDFELADSGQARTIDTVTREQGTSGRVVAIFLDEYHVDVGSSTDRVRAALRQLVDAELRDDDLVAIMKPLEPLNAIELSSDRARILEAIDSFAGRKRDYAPASNLEQQIISRAPAAADASRAQVVTAALQALAKRLGDAGTGRKSIVLVSDGFTPALPRGSDRTTGAARTIVYAANRFGVSIYPVSPHLAQSSQSEQTDPEADQAASLLNMLAEQTGGQATINQSDLLPGLTRAVRDLNDYYIVTYRPQLTGDGKFHRVELRVKRRDAQVRARSGYWSPTPAAPSASLSRPMMMMMTRPAHSSPYIRPWIGTSRGADGLTTITITWESGTAPPRNRRVDAVAVKALSPDGGVLFQGNVRSGQTTTFDAPPGSVALELNLQDVGGGSIDTDVRSIRVPDLRPARPIFATPQLIRTRTARAFGDASQNQGAVPSPAREFSRTERLLLRVPVYGPGDTVPDVTAVLLNRLGARMWELPRVPGPLSNGLVQFDLPLASLAPEEYRVELSARAGSQEAKEVLLFRVVN